MRSLTRSVAVIILAVPYLGAASAAAQEQVSADAANPFGRKYPARIYRTVRLLGKPPVIDGRLDDSAWSQGEWAGDYTQQMPTEGAKPSQPTELKILYDDEFVYFAVRAYDDPDKVHRYPGRRDDLTGDIVGVCFNSYNDKRIGFEFDLTAGGSKIDLILGNGETEWDTSWDAVWDGEVAHDANGWTAEFRVPFSQLRYGPQKEQIWGLHAWRWIDRYQEESQWQLIPRQNTGRMYNLGELHGIHGLARQRHVELLPYVVGKTTSSPGAGTDPTSAVGLDAKAGITTNFTLDATVNPDFGQVEADPSVINLTAYETFYDEKRPFFLEGRKILTFAIEDEDQLFYTRRIGQAPSYAPAPGVGESVQNPESTTILSAVKLTGKTPDGMSVGILQSLTQKETARISSSLDMREQVVEPFTSYTVARLHKDWGQGNTSLGGMVTSTRRWISDPALESLPALGLTGGVDLTRHFANRSWLLEASGIFSRVSGDREAIQALQTNAVHYYQRPDASHLGVGPNATSMSGHGGSVRFGRSEHGRLRLLNHFHWYSPGLELNDVGYLRQADLLANQVFLGWNEASPKGVFRTYSAELSREDEWDFGGLQTVARTGLEAEARFQNRWVLSGSFTAQHALVDTRLLRGGPAMRLSAFQLGCLKAETDSSRRVHLTTQVCRQSFDEGGSSASTIEGGLNVRPTNRLSIGVGLNRVRAHDDLQYVTTGDTGAGPRWVLGRIDQDTWSFTARANLSITPELTVQYYGSPFIGTGRYEAFKKATNTLARSYGDRFYLYGPDEIAYDYDANRYEVTEARNGATLSYAFDNPDFSFRQFRSNMVVRWEYKPGSSLYVVWSQGRTSEEAYWNSSFSSNWDALWRTPAEDVFLVKLTYWFSP